MKLTGSVRRELSLLSRSVYGYAEIAIALIFLLALLVLVPERFDKRITEYCFLNLPPAQAGLMEAAMRAGVEGEAKALQLKAEGRDIKAQGIEGRDKRVILVASQEDLVALSREEGAVGVMISQDGQGLLYDYYLQGSETERYQGFVRLILSNDLLSLSRMGEPLPVKLLKPGHRPLNDRQSLLPMMLSVNCVLMGILATAAYIIEDKSSQVIRALRVAPASMLHYLLAKVLAVMILALATCLIITVPVMGSRANYPQLILIVLSGGFFACSLGALLASYYEDMQKAFAMIYLLMMLMLLPALLGLMPSLSGAAWLRFFPSYYVLQGIRDALEQNEGSFVYLSSLGLLLAGLAMMPLSLRRYKATGIGGS